MKLPSALTTLLTLSIAAGCTSPEGGPACPLDGGTWLIVDGGMPDGYCEKLAASSTGLPDPFQQLLTICPTLYPGTRNLELLACEDRSENTARQTACLYL